MSIELTVDIFDPESVDRAISRLDRYVDWLDGYTDRIAAESAAILAAHAKSYAHVKTGQMKHLIRYEYGAEGVYHVLTDPVSRDRRTKQYVHYALKEHEGYNEKTQACEEQADRIGGPGFFYEAIDAFFDLHQLDGIAEREYVW